MDFAKPHQNERIPVKSLWLAQNKSQGMTNSVNEIEVTSFDILPVAITSESFGLCWGLGEHFPSAEVALFLSNTFPR
jgi:hypothetical protein